MGVFLEYTQNRYPLNRIRLFLEPGSFSSTRALPRLVFLSHDIRGIDTYVSRESGISGSAKVQIGTTIPFRPARFSQHDPTNVTRDACTEEHCRILPHPFRHAAKISSMSSRACVRATRPGVACPRQPGLVPVFRLQAAARSHTKQSK